MSALLFAELDASRLGQAFGYMIVYVPVFGVVAFFGASIARLFTPGRSSGWVVGAVLSGILTVSLLFFAAILTQQKLGGGLSGSSTGGSSAASGTEADGKSSGRVFTTDHAVSIQLPTGWKEDPKLAIGAPLGAGNQAREQYLLISATPKSDFGGDLDSFVKINAQQMMSRLDGAEMTSLGEHPVGGCPAVHRRFDGKIRDLSVVYCNAYVETKDSFYILITWTLKSRESTSFPVLKQAIDSFEAQAGPPADAASSVPEKKEPK